MPDNQSSPEKAERPQSDLKIDVISTYNTGTAISKYDRISPNPAFRHISTRKGRSTNGRLKYQRAKQIQGLLKKKKKQGVPTGTQGIPTAIFTGTCRYTYRYTCRRNSLPLHEHHQLCSTGSRGVIQHGIIGPSAEEEEEKHTPTADGSTGRKRTSELQHQVDADILATGAVPTPTWKASPGANHYDNIA